MPTIYTYERSFVLEAMMFFEDFEVGARYTAGPRLISPAHMGWLTDLATGTSVLGPAVASGLWTSLGLLGETLVAVVSESWSLHAPIVVGDKLSLTTTVVRLTDAGPGLGELTRHNELTNHAGHLVCAGSTTERVRGSGGTRSTARDVGTLAWGRDLAARLGGDPTFAAAVSAWDGTIGLRGGKHEVHLRVYRGRIIDVTGRAPHGATFTFGASDPTWAQVLSEPGFRFATAMLTDGFETSGDPYEGLRMTKVIEIVVEAARGMARQRIQSGTARSQ